VTRLHHSIQAAFNKTIISLFQRNFPQSNVTKPSRKLNSSSTNDAICNWATGILFIQKFWKQSFKRDKIKQKIFQLPTEMTTTKPKISTKRRIIFTMNNIVQGNTTYKIITRTKTWINKTRWTFTNLIKNWKRFPGSFEVLQLTEQARWNWFSIGKELWSLELTNWRDNWAKDAKRHSQKPVWKHVKCTGCRPDSVQNMRKLCILRNCGGGRLNHRFCIGRIGRYWRIILIELLGINIEIFIESVVCGFTGD